MSSQEKERVDIIVPCYNPQQGWEIDLVNRFQEFQQSLPAVELRCILVNDGSTKEVESAQIDHIRQQIPKFLLLSSNENRGKGHAIRTGIAKADTQIVGFTDVDFPYQTSYMHTMYSKIKSNEADVVIGHRRHNYYEKIPLIRRLLSKTLRQLIKLMLNIPVADTQSGLKFFNTKGKDVLLSTTVDRYLFDLEFVKLAAKHSLRIESIELELREGIKLPPFAMSILWRELGNFAKILFR